MSPLWRDQIHVFFAPERVDLVRVPRRLSGLKQPEQVPKTTMLCQRDTDQSISESPLHQLEQMVQDAAGAEMMITLSNHFVRYTTLPPQAEISAPDEVYAYAAFRMREIYGTRVDEWILSMSAWDPIKGAICAAINRDLLTRFEEMAVRCRIKLKGLEPYLASTFDNWKQLLDAPRTCFALVETGRICIALLASGVWQIISNQKILHAVEDELLAALDQEAILSGYKEPVEQVYLFAPEHPGLVLPQDCGWEIVPIQTVQLPVLAHYPSAIVDQGEMKECIV